MDQNENWLPVVGHEGKLEVSDCGNIRDAVTGKHKNLYSSLGYKTIGTYENGKTKTKFVHRLVAIAFIPNPENKPQVNHKNSKRSDNRVSNLEWVTKRENVIHGIKFGMMNINGESNHSSKLINEDVFRIRELRDQGMKMKDIGDMFGVTEMNVSYICNRKSWKHI